MKRRDLIVVDGSGPFADGQPASGRAARAIFLRVIRECVWPHKRLMLILLIAMSFTAATAGALPFILQKVGDGIFVKKSTTLLFTLPLLVLLVMTLRAAADWATTVTEASLGTKVVADLRARMFDTIAAADLAWIQRNHSGRFVSTFSHEAPIVNQYVVKVLSGLFKNGMSVALLIGAMLYMDWRLGSVVLIGAPLAILNLRHQKVRIKHSSRRSMAAPGDLSSMLTQTLQGMRIVKAYGQEAREAQRLRQTVSAMRRLVMKTIRSRATISPIWDAVVGIGLAAAILYGGWQGIEGRVTLGQFMGFMTAALLAFQPLKALTGIQATLTEGLLAAERVFGVIDHVSHVTESPAAKPLRVSVGAITLRNISFSYEEGGPAALNDLSLEIPAGQRVALVGPSGAGKSTVLNLILASSTRRAARC
jgi:subfamily B ATP-binding cassette protein MsbA